jgi:O-antigen/teichoic acid export membrane protein
MSLSRTIFWNTFIQFIGRAISTILGVMVLVIMTRALGPDGFGGYTTISSYLQFFGIIVDFGLSLTANRMLGEIEEKEKVSYFMSNLITLRFFSAFFFLGLAPLIALFFFPYPSVIKQGIFLATFSFLAIALTQTLVPIFQKNFRMEKVVLAEVTSRLVLLFFVSLVAWFRLGLLWFVGAVVMGSLANYLFLSFSARHFVHLKWSFDFSLWRKIVRMSWPIGISIIFNLIYLKADIIILSFFRSQTEVGFYGAAYRVLDILTGLATMFMGLVLPVITAAWVKGDYQRFQYLLQRSFEAMAFMALPTMVVGVFLGRPLMSLVAGREFVVSGDVLGILIVAMGAVFFSTLFGHVVVVLNKQKPMIWAYAIDAFLSLIGYLVFIPKFGIWGAAWMTVFSEGLMVFFTYLMVVKTSHLVLHWKVFGKILFSTLVAALVIWFWRDFQWVLAAFLGITVYFVLLYFTQAIDKETIREIIKIQE